MGKFLSIFLCLLFFLALSNAACQYADMKNVTNTVPTYYYNNQKLDGTPVIITAYAHTDTGQYKPCNDNFRDSFNVVNQVNGNVNIQLSYNFNGQLKTQDISFGPRETKQIYETYRACPVGSCSLSMCTAPPPQLDAESISVAIEETNGLELRQDTITQEQRICRECPENSGQACLNDGQKADYAAMCGSGKMNASNRCISLEQAQQEDAQSKDIFYQINSFFAGIWHSITDFIWQISVVIVISILFILLLKSSSGGGSGPIEPDLPDEIHHIYYPRR